MKNANDIINFFTGLAGLIMWFYLTLKHPESAVHIALGLLAVLMGFGGRETIKEILQIFKNGKRD